MQGRGPNQIKPQGSVVEITVQKSNLIDFELIKPFPCDTSYAPYNSDDSLQNRQLVAPQPSDCHPSSHPNFGSTPGNAGVLAMEPVDQYENRRLIETATLMEDFRRVNLFNSSYYDLPTPR